MCVVVVGIVDHLPNNINNLCTLFPCGWEPPSLSAMFLTRACFMVCASLYQGDFHNELTKQQKLALTQFHSTYELAIAK